MTSDPSVTLADVQAKPVTECSAHVDDALGACADVEDLTVLRTQHGERVYDAEDIFVLCRLDEIRVMLDAYGIKRRVMTTAVPRSANERHMRDFGHKLGFGCCRNANFTTKNEVLGSSDAA